MTESKTIQDDPLYKLLRDEQVEAFNQSRQSAPIDLSGAELRGSDLRGLKANNINFTNGYFRNADLRGIDFRETQLDGASLAEAKISGCFFPAELSADEIRLSVERGTRLRHS